MLRKDLPRECYLCLYRKPLSYSEDFLCDIKGIVSPHYSCRHFSFDAFNIPNKKKRKIKPAKKYSEDDFSL